MKSNKKTYFASWKANNGSYSSELFHNKQEALEWARQCAKGERYPGNTASFYVIEMGRKLVCLEDKFAYQATISRTGRVTYNIKNHKILHEIDI